MRSRLSKRKRLTRTTRRSSQIEQEAANRTSDRSSNSTPLFLSSQQGGNSANKMLQSRGDKEKAVVQPKPAAGAPIYLQRLCSPCEEEEQQSAQPGRVQAKSKKSTTSSAAPVTRAVGSPGAGQSLPPHVRKRVEPVLGQNMKHVRVHDDSGANQAAESLNARAFTHQNHIYLGKHESPADVGLMAHEATHALQQQGGLGLLQKKRERKSGSQAAGYLQRQMDAGVPDAATPAETPSPADAGVGLPAGVPEQPEVPAGKNACPTAEEEQEKNRFRFRIFSVERFRPSAGYGVFDASYLPISSIMTVVSKMKFNFLEARNTPDIFTLATMLANGQDISIFFWSEAEKRQYKRDYVDRVARRWSFQHSFRSNKPCWPFVAMPYITPRIVDNDSDAHYMVNAYRDSGRSNFSARNPGTAGWQGSGNVDYYDVQEDPDRQSRAVARSERERLERAISTASASPITFARGSSNPDVASMVRLKTLAELMKLKNPSDPSIPVILHGYASKEGKIKSNARLAHKRAFAVAAILRAQGVPQPLVVTSHGGVGTPFDASNRKVELRPSRTFETTYSSNRFGPAEHEFGHAIGLPDEYANHPAGTNLGDKQQAFIDLARRAGVSPPDQWGDMTSSMMSAGIDVLPRHYLTIWEALGEMTSPHITRDQWDID